MVYHGSQNMRQKLLNTKKLSPAYKHPRVILPLPPLRKKLFADDHRVHQSETSNTCRLGITEKPYQHPEGSEPVGQKSILHKLAALLVGIGNKVISLNDHQPGTIRPPKAVTMAINSIALAFYFLAAVLLKFDKWLHTTPPNPYTLTKGSQYHLLKHFSQLGSRCAVYLGISEKDPPVGPAKKMEPPTDKDTLEPKANPGSINQYRPR